MGCTYQRKEISREIDAQVHRNEWWWWWWFRSRGFKFDRIGRSLAVALHAVTLHCSASIVNAQVPECPTKSLNVFDIPEAPQRSWFNAFVSSCSIWLVPSKRAEWMESALRAYSVSTTLLLSTRWGEVRVPHRVAW